MKKLLVALLAVSLMVGFVSCSKAHRVQSRFENVVDDAIDDMDDTMSRSELEEIYDDACDEADEIVEKVYGEEIADLPRKERREIIKRISKDIKRLNKAYNKNLKRF